MAKRARKQRTEAERAEIEADRVAAHDNVEVDKAWEALKEAEAKDMTSSSLADYLEAPLDAEVTPEQDAALEKFMGDGEDEGVEIRLVDSDTGLALEDADEKPEPNSIVKDKFKVRYIENAKLLGVNTKAAKRSNWDWLSQTLAAACLSDKGKIEIGAFTDILDANGVDHSRWTNKNKGWEGRFRMTGRVALQKIVANAGQLVLPGGETVEAPHDWRVRYQTKA